MREDGGSVIDDSGGVDGAEVGRGRWYAVGDTG